MATAVHDLAVARKSSRKRVLLRATVFAPDGAYSVLIRDISCTGASVYGESALPAGSDVIFKRGGVFVAGNVAWSSERAAGIEFYRSLAERDVESAKLPI